MKNPTLLDVMDRKAENERLDIHTALPARVISFNGHTATIELMINQILHNGEVLELPPLVDVVVQFPRAGGFCFTVPVTSGDEGLAIFSERCIDGWYSTGNKSVPLDARLHDYSDASFIPGVCSQPKKIPSYFSGGASMQTDDGSTFIRMTQGKITILGDIEHLGNSKQTGNHEQSGNWNQTKGNSESSGTIKAMRVIGGGVDVETHTHPDSHGGNTGRPNK
ncbi:Gp138 family membrane-puncturing spike protein [Xenorhabdus griffiniae]|uniref:Gp138 family membrane-puncturing spike protein n=1 Tax=Xenorhabdus griffiniae TaxID=351672 RepID=A0ABY9XE85_9GAMM|nr:Gp138 family membrane-puncturing spike protein [Xenorhabdus griffiniae]MBD1228396.1 baseplate protein [Xenorhabdus griffiniae]MBE8587951.1 baseplate protein [Xenorhabdus griffiniae]WMV71223.1 Gp138 family membrane-puncturing spike protein [Xenorhabdus griffiniae]WNH00899.1 Gp138 family membrane-puncturing spike protein [Xenorhabdus griffiniae]